MQHQSRDYGWEMATWISDAFTAVCINVACLLNKIRIPLIFKPVYLNYVHRQKSHVKTILIMFNYKIYDNISASTKGHVWMNSLLFSFHTDELSPAEIPVTLSIDKCTDTFSQQPCENRIIAEDSLPILRFYRRTTRCEILETET